MKKLPGFIKPMMTTLMKSAFNDPEWLFETKWDGYRALACVGSKVDLYSRNNTSFNTLFQPIVTDLEKINGSCILDGEIVILDQKGKSDFQLMQNYQSTQAGDLYYYAFDLLYWNGEDLRERSLTSAKKCCARYCQSPLLSLCAIVSIMISIFVYR